ncbi:hypothetical protein PENTCL1PPCAC_23357, partial [Pristionchus entomophagus]
VISTQMIFHEVKKLKNQGGVVLSDSFFVAGLKWKWEVRREGSNMFIALRMADPYFLPNNFLSRWTAPDLLN